jgi:SAM-dependent methyltransferase
MAVDYDAQAGKWKRDKPKHHSDFCGRPEVFDIVIENGLNKVILDLGCGEGYFSRKLARTARKVIGIDRSEEMIRLAKEREEQERMGIRYHVGDVRNMPFKPASFDICVGNYITNYIHPDELSKFYREMARVLRQDGKFVLLMPHPVFELCTDFGEAIQYEGTENYSYRDSRGEFFNGVVRGFDGGVMPIGLYHSTLNDHSAGLVAAGLGITKLMEPIFPRELAEKHPVFKDLAEKIACMILVGEKLPSVPQS